MRKNENKRKKVQMPSGIRQKMMAAISMLMVSSIMLVSSTYAWFTLSTAPEVTGITTNVGANGNLEMLLLTGSLNDSKEQEGSYYSSDEDLGVVSNVGDSMANPDKTVEEANVTWGNLVDLSAAAYGLDNIVLSPARLNLSASGADYVVDDTMLKVPSYGTDGRVIAINNDTFTGRWNAEDDKFAYDENHKGVRVIGTTTNVSQQVSAYRTASKAVTRALNNATATTTTSLYNQAQNLTNLLIKYVKDSSNAKFTEADIAPLKSILTELNKANASVEEAIINGILAYNLSSKVDEDGNGTLTNEEVNALKSKIEAIDITDETISVEGVTIPDAAETAIEKYKALDKKTTDAIDSLETLKPDSDGNYVGSTIVGIIEDIINKQYVKIGNITNPNSDQVGDIASSIVAKEPIEMLSGSGVFADLAELAGNIIVSDVKITVSYSGININKMPVTMKTSVTVGPYASINVGTAPGSSTEKLQDAEISDTYGYVLDFGFRTNAGSSELQLQTAAVNRVYTDQTNTEINTEINTQGSGSYMEFASTNVATFTAEDVLKLMSAIRVAFVDVSSDKLLAMGALDINVTDADSNGIMEYSTTDTGTTEVTGGYKSPLYLYDYTYNDGELRLTNKLDDKSAILSLAQNIASKVSVIVYLDGDKIDNTMVANATQSMTGKMNLQFSSSATLAPMENTDMRGGGLGTPDKSVTFEDTPIASENGEYEYKGYKGTVNPGYFIYQGSDNALYFTDANKTVFTKLTTANVLDVLSITEIPSENVIPGDDDTISNDSTGTPESGDDMPTTE